MLTPLPSNAARRRTVRRRLGMTLLELLISLVLVGLLGGLTVGFLLKQQRFYAGANEILLTRTQVRQAATMLPSDLRSISATGGDIYAMTDTSVEFRSTFGSTYICRNDRTNLRIAIPPVTLASRSVLTSWSQVPAVDDSLALYVDSTNTGARDDTWSMHRITAVTPVTTDAAPGCQSTSLMMKATDVSSTNPSYAITLSTQQSVTVAPGAAVRFFRKVHYSLYRAADGLWYLGYYDCKPNRTPSCSAIQPIAGPFRPYNASQPAASGLRFTYFDSLGAVTTNRLSVTRISVLLQGEGAKAIQLAGGAPVQFRDSVRIEVGLRNWR